MNTHLIRTLAAGGIVLTVASTPAAAQVSVGVGVGGPGYNHHWCHNHPGACRPRLLVEPVELKPTGVKPGARR